MKNVLLLLISLFAFDSKAEQLYNPNDTGWHLMELDELAFTYIDYFPNGHSPLVTDNGLPNRQLGKGIALNMNANVLKYLYWNNKVHGTTEELVGTNKGQFRLIGYQFEFGLRPFNWLEVEYHHHSQHSLDHVYPYGHFPVEDAIQIKIYLWRSKKVDSIL